MRRFARRLKRRLKLHLSGISPERAAWIASDDFLKSFEWRQIRYKALEANDGRCECCGRSKHQLLPGEYFDVDHIKSRRESPEMALEISNLQVLCGSCNHGKGNTSRELAAFRPSASHQITLDYTV